MSQINLHTTPEFEQQLDLLMHLKAFPSKSEAIRMAVAAQARVAQREGLRHDFSALIGLIKVRQPGRFVCDGALWEKDRGPGAGSHGG